MLFRQYTLSLTSVLLSETHSHTLQTLCSDGLRSGAEEEEFEVKKPQDLVARDGFLHLCGNLGDLAWFLVVLPFHQLCGRVLRALLEKLVLCVRELDQVEVLVKRALGGPRLQSRLPDRRRREQLLIGARPPVTLRHRALAQEKLVVCECVGVEELSEAVLLPLGELQRLLEQLRRVAQQTLEVPHLGVAEACELDPEILDAVDPLHQRRHRVIHLLRVEVHVRKRRVPLILHLPPFLLATLDARRVRQHPEHLPSEADALGEVCAPFLQQSQRLLHQHDLAPPQRRVDENVHQTAGLELLSQRTQTLGRVWQVVENSDAVDKVVLAIEVGDVVERHVVEHGVVGLADQIRSFRTLLRHIQCLPRKVKSVEMRRVRV
mmetsp:Transcript_48383/g.96888  ORF Transcript_48383/g.96888 Transcript_48383/m.96888 type:complete len:377 (+) Transcript_48383:107-1237(+)